MSKGRDRGASGSEVIGTVWTWMGLNCELAVGLGD
jgi:hypothetical protein